MGGRFVFSRWFFSRQFAKGPTYDDAAPPTIGFGIEIDPKSIVRNWKNVRNQMICNITQGMQTLRSLPPLMTTTIALLLRRCGRRFFFFSPGQTHYPLMWWQH